MNKILNYWESIRSSLWFVPSLIVASSIALAIGIIEIDALGLTQRLPERWPRLFGAQADGSRSLLAAIRSSMITVAGVTFSITVVTLALASTQYSRRILRSFGETLPTRPCWASLSACLSTASSF